MAKSISPLTDDMQNIIDCSLYNDPRVLVKRHTFCVDCSERKSTGENLCPLCRTFQEVQDTGCHGYPGNYVKEELSDLHQLFVEKSLNVTGEKQFGEALQTNSDLIFCFRETDQCGNFTTWNVSVWCSTFIYGHLVIESSSTSTIIISEKSKHKLM